VQLPDAAPLTPPAEFLAAAAELGVEFEPGDVERLGQYLALLLETNKAINLTAVTDPAQAWMRHILDSLTLLQLLADLPDGGAVIDVGTGGGLPGVPLAICSPQLKVTLLEATGKKAEFLSGVADRLELSNVRVVHDRAEHAGHLPEHREHYAAAVARAVGPLAVIAELTVPFVKLGGRSILIKGQKADEELAAAKQALHKLHAVHEGTIETPTGRVVVLGKPRKTPSGYPRRSGEPKAHPL
jgi:16S rRNA (guanine527-N7)-methyltransferase